MSDTSAATATATAVDADADHAAQMQRATELVMPLATSYFNHRYAEDGTPSPLVAITELLRSGNVYEKEEAAGAVCNLSSIDERTQSDLADSGAIACLVELLNDGEINSVKEKAISALRAVANGSLANTVAAVNVGAIPQLVQLLRFGTEELQIAAAWTLLSFALEPQAETIQLVIIHADGIDAIVHVLRTGSPGVLEFAVRLLVALRLATKTYGARIVAAGGLSPLVELLTHGTEGLKPIAAQVIASLTTDADKDATMAAGVLAPLVVMLRQGTSGDNDKYWAARALGNLAVNVSGEKRVVLVDVVATHSVISLMREDNNKHFMVWVLCNLAYCCPANQDTLIEAGVAGPLVHLLRTGDADARRMAVMTMGNLAWRNRKNQEIVVMAGVVPVAMVMLQSGDDEQKWTAADVLGDIVRENPAMQHTVAHAGAIDLLVELVKNGSDKQKIKAVRGLGKLAKGNKLIQSQIGRTGVIDVVVDLVATGLEELQTMATRVLGKLVENHAANQSLVVKARAISVLVINWRNSTSDKLKQTTARTLRHLSDNQDACSAIEALGGQELLAPAAAVRSTV